MAARSRLDNSSTAGHQLSLFSETTDAEVVDNLKEESLNDRSGSAHSLGTSDFGSLEKPSAEDGRESGAREAPSTGDLRSAGVNGQSPVRADSGPEDRVSPGVGNRDEGMGVSPGRGRPTPVVIRSGDARSAPALARDLRITAAHAIGEGSLKQKAQANLTAVRILKTIESENRTPTSEEQSALVKYSGWGAVPNAFAPQPPQEWQSVASELHDLLTADEYASARASTPNAHYTSPEVVKAIWLAMEQFGLAPGAHI